MPAIRLHLPTIVLLTWAGLWAVGVQGVGVVVVALVVYAAGQAISCRESVHRHRHRSRYGYFT